MIQAPKSTHDALVELAMERIEKGLAPPQEIYRVQIRRRIDWSQFPEWARPVDPEMFDCHEG
jgi:hypothetical protein